MVTRILNSAFFVLAVGCSALLPGRLLAQGEGSRSLGTLSGGAGAEEEASADPRVSSLAPRAQKAIGKAFEALGNHATLTTQGATQVRKHLETAYRVAPSSAEVSYLFGVYWLQMDDRVKAKACWTRAIKLYPQHYRSLISLGQALVDEEKLDEAVPYLERAVEAEPSYWRAHAIYADLCLRQGLPEEAVKHAERALDLGHGEAAVVQRYLAAALTRLGEKDRAVGVLQAYVRDNHGDTAARKQLERLQLAEAQNARSVETSSQEMVEPWTLDRITALLPTNWLPPDTDRKVPPVEPGASCALDEVVKKAGHRIEELVSNVDRFTATESLQHEKINKWGLETAPEKRRFDYVVSIKEAQARLFDVQEFRQAAGAPGDFADGLQSNGLPALVLVFHPYNIESFDLTCEGLARWNGRRAWQVHFSQKPNNSNTLRAYKSGINGFSYPVALKGRAWIAADSYQIVRLETDLVRPIPEIRLAAEHTVIEYGPVRFRERNVNMWLPQSAEVYSDWRGRRFHLRHSFSKYMLFSVDDKQTISTPKAPEETLPKSPCAKGSQSP